MKWGKIQFGDLCEHSAFGPRFSSKEYAEDGNIATLRTKDISLEGRIEYGTMPLADLDPEKFSNHFLQLDDLVVTRSGRVGTAAIFTGYRLPVLPGAFLIRFRLNKKIANPRFYLYFFNSKYGQNLIESIATGSVQQNINITNFNTLEVPFPPREKQDAIADVGELLERKIELNRRLNQTLESIAQAIFQSWFVDFDPVKAKQAALALGYDPERAAMAALSGKLTVPKDPDDISTAMLDEAEARLDELSDDQRAQLKQTALLFPSRLVESELGLIPEGWEILEANDIATIGIGKTPPRKETEWFVNPGEGVRWVSIRDMGESGAFMLTSREELTEEAVSRFNVRVVPDYTVLVSFKLTIGRVAITDGPTTTNEAIAHFKLARYASLSTEFLFLYLKQFEYTTLGSTSSIATAVNSKTIRSMPILVPQSEVIKSFSRVVRPLFSQVKNSQSESISLSEIRNALLPELMSGNLI